MPDIKTALFQAASEAFKDGEVSVKLITPDDPKIAKRNFVENQIGVRVQFKGTSIKQVFRDGKITERHEPVTYAVAGFIPENSKPEEVGKLITRLKLDKRNAEAALTPAVPV